MKQNGNHEYSGDVLKELSRRREARKRKATEIELSDLMRDVRLLNVQMEDEILNLAFSHHSRSLVKQLLDDKNEAIKKVLRWMCVEDSDLPVLKRDKTQVQQSVGYFKYTGNMRAPNTKCMTDYRDENGRIVAREFLSGDNLDAKITGKVIKGSEFYDKRTHEIMLYHPDGSRAAKISLDYVMSHSKGLGYEMPKTAYVSSIEYYYPRREVSVDRYRCNPKPGDANEVRGNSDKHWRVVLAGHIAKNESYSPPSFFSSENGLESRLSQVEHRLGSGLNVREKKVRNKSGEVEWERTESFARGRAVEVKAEKIMAKLERHRRGSGKPEESPSQVRRLLMQELEEVPVSMMGARISI